MGDNQESKTWPCLIVKDGEFRVVGSSLLGDGRYALISEKLLRDVPAFKPVEESSSPSANPRGPFGI